MKNKTKEELKVTHEFHDKHHRHLVTGEPTACLVGTQWMNKSEKWRLSKITPTHETWEQEKK